MRVLESMDEHLGRPNPWGHLVVLEMMVESGTGAAKRRYDIITWLFATRVFVVNRV
jgi:hypothetical protein